MACYALLGGSSAWGNQHGHLDPTQNSQAESEQKLKAYACELEQRLEARTRELSEAREQQAATAEVLHVISDSPGKLERVFETILAHATLLIDVRHKHQRPPDM
jgi:hypothetical protein